MEDDFEELPAPSHDQEPSEEEIIEYFKWLGGDPNTDSKLMWIARNALREPIPEGWKLYRKKNEDGDPFYFNTQTGESLWDHPKDQEYKQLFQQEKAKIEKGLESIPRPLPSSSKYTAGSSQLFDIDESDTHNDSSELNQSSNVDSFQELSNKRNELNLEMQRLISEHNDHIEKEKARYEKTLSNLRTQYEKQISDEEKRQKEKIEEIKANHKKEIEELKQKNNREKDRVKSDYSQNLQSSQSSEISQMKENFEDEIEKLKDSFNTEKQEAIKNHEDEMAELQQKQKSIEKQKEKLKKLEAELEEQKQQLTESNNEEIEEITRKHQQNVEKLKKKQQREIQELNENFDPDQQLQELQMSLKKKQREIQAKFDKEMDELKSQHEAEMDELQNSTTNSNKMNFGLQSLLGNQFSSEKSNSEFQKQMEELKQEQEKEIAKQKKKHQKILAQNEEKFQHDLELAKTKQETERLREETQIRRDYEAKKVSIENQLKEDIEKQKQLKMEQLKRQLEKDIENAQEKQLIDIRNSNEQKKKEMMVKFQDEQVSLKKTQEKELSKLRKQHQKQIEEEDFKFNQEMKIAKTKHETERMKVEDQYRREIDQVRAALIEKKKREEYEKQTLNNPYQDPSIQVRLPYQQQQENIIDFDEKTMSKFKKLQYKMEKIKSQFDASYGNFPASLKELLGDINNVCQGYKNLISEQNKTMTKMVSDFQQQTSQLARQFQTSLADVENSYRAALNAYANGGGIGVMGQFQLQPPPIVQTEYARPSSRRRYQNSEDSEDDYPLDRKVKVVYQGTRKYKKYRDEYE